MIRSNHIYFFRIALLSSLVILVLAIAASLPVRALAEGPTPSPVGTATPVPAPTEPPTPAPVLTQPQVAGTLLVSFKGSLDSITSDSLVVNGTRIWHEGNIPPQIKSAPADAFVLGSANFDNGRQMINLYSPSFDGIIESMTVPNSKGEYFIYVNGSPLLMTAGVKVEGGNLVEGIRVVGSTEGILNNVKNISVVTPFPLDIFGGNPSYPWPIYALFALWVPVLGLILLIIMGRNKKALALEEAEVTQAVQNAATDELDPEEQADENEVQTMESTEKDEQLAFEQMLNEYAVQGITLPQAGSLDLPSSQSETEPDEEAPQAQPSEEPAPDVDPLSPTQPVAVAVQPVCEISEGSGRSRRKSAREEFLARQQRG